MNAIAVRIRWLRSIPLVPTLVDADAAQLLAGAREPLALPQVPWILLALLSRHGRAMWNRAVVQRDLYNYEIGSTRDAEDM